MAKTDGVARIIALAALGKNGGSSTGGTTNYLELANKPKINNVELTGNKTLEDLGINIPDLENYYTKDMVNEAFLTKTNTTSFTPTGDYNPATKKYVDDNVKTYTAGENIIISEDNVISANVSGGIDSNAVYTYYAPYSDDDWFTEENVANILQTVKDKGYSNFELCTLNGNHYALRKGGNLQALTTTEEYYELEYLPNDLKNYVYYFFVARLNEGGKIVVDGLGTQTYTAQEMVETYLPETLQKISGYDSSASHLILQSNNGIFEWDSSLDGGIFGDSYTDPAYYTEKQVDKIVTDTVNEALGGRY
jgi:hypothetical protein